MQPVRKSFSWANVQISFSWVRWSVKCATALVQILFPGKLLIINGLSLVQQELGKLL
jgi:hypothetical protein